MAGRKLVSADSKACEICGGIFARKPRSGVLRWERRKTCSRKCASLHKRTLETQSCPQCNQQFQPTSRRAKYCSRECSAKASTGPLPQKGMHEKYIRVVVEGRGRLLEHRVVMEGILGRELVRGESVHHVNGDTKDNRPENLELWYRGQPAGQRVSDLIDYIASHHAEAIIERHRQRLLLSNLLGK